jgi:hypothetical protein
VLHAPPISFFSILSPEQYTMRSTDHYLAKKTEFRFSDKNLELQFHCRQHMYLKLLWIFKA